MLVTRPPGYLLQVEPGALDLGRFERLAGEGGAALGAGDPAARGGRLRAALALWRGPALADLASAPFAQARSGRGWRSCGWKRLRSGSRPTWRSGAPMWSPELEALVAEHPLRERLRGQLMLALYRVGAPGRGARRLPGRAPGAGGRAGHRAAAASCASSSRRSCARTPRSTSHRPDRLRPPGAGFVGRERELGVLHGALDDALAGNGRLVLVGGEPGIGKSRLAEELAPPRPARGARVCVGRCWEAGGAPAYWPWVQALRAYSARGRPWTPCCAQPRAGGAELGDDPARAARTRPGPPGAAPPEAEGGASGCSRPAGAFLRNGGRNGRSSRAGRPARR